jgi:hypothetical protein
VNEEQSRRRSNVSVLDFPFGRVSAGVLFLPLLLAQISARYAFGAAGSSSDAHRTLNQLEEQSARSYLSSRCIAEIYLGLGDEDRIFEWLEKAYEERARTLVMLNVEPESLARDRVGDLRVSCNT